MLVGYTVPSNTSRSSTVPPPDVQGSNLRREITLEAIAKLLDDKISPLQASHTVSASQITSFQSEVQSTINAHDQRMISIETQLADMPSSTIDSEARASIKSIEQKLQLLSISINERSRSTLSRSNDVHINHAGRDECDARISFEQSLTVVIGGLQSNTAYLLDQINFLCNAKPIRTYSKG